jgi:NAD(P)-dependent dehydrogenase (short-subunit alcohol dehydrogenase family)
MTLENKIAVITGGNSGIGLATAHEFKALGARVILIGRNAEAVAKAAAEVGGDTLPITADVSRLADIDRAFAIIREKAGRVDVLFVNAGIAQFVPLSDCTEDLYDSMVDTNLKGAFFTVQRALPLLSNGASIIFTSSVAAHLGVAGASIYTATKGALNGLSRALAVELGPLKIRVNVVSPGPITTPIFDKMGMNKEALDQVAAQLTATMPLARFGESSEVAKAVAFLASGDSSFVSGAEILIDGGMVAA